MITQVGGSGTVNPVSARRSGSRPQPERCPELGHLTLDALRTYRQELVEEESRVSYWRRIVQARIDLILAVDHNDLTRLRGALADPDARSRRQALLAVLPADDVPPLPDLAVLWRSEPDPADEQAVTALVTALGTAESALSSYRQALHKRLDRATAELIARYHQDPQQCLVALPLR
jgi:hypothetical protein